MSKIPKNSPIISQSLNDRLRYLRLQWRKLRRISNKLDNDYMTLKRDYIYFMVKVDGYKQSRLAELLDVSGERISRIMKEIEAKGGATK